MLMDPNRNSVLDDGNRAALDRQIASADLFRNLGIAELGELAEVGS